MIWNRGIFHCLLVTIVLLSTTPHHGSSAVISEDASDVVFHKEVNESPLQPSFFAPRTMMATMSRLMEYFRNADIFASIRAMLDNSNGVRKEWVPLGSLMFSRPLGQGR